MTHRESNAPGEAVGEVHNPDLEPDKPLNPPDTILARAALDSEQLPPGVTVRGVPYGFDYSHGRQEIVAAIKAARDRHRAAQ